MKLTNEEVYGMTATLSQMLDKEYNKTFSIACARNFRELQPYAQDIEPHLQDEEILSKTVEVSIQTIDEGKVPEKISPRTYLTLQPMIEE